MLGVYTILVLSSLQSVGNPPGIQFELFSVSYEYKNEFRSPQQLIVDTVYAVMQIFIYVLNVWICVANTVLVKRRVYEHYEGMISKIRCPKPKSIRMTMVLVAVELSLLCAVFLSVFIYTGYARPFAQSKVSSSHTRIRLV